MKKIDVLTDRGEVSEEKFSALEQTHSIKFPQSFKGFISKHDAPWIDGNHFRFINRYANTCSWSYRIIDGFDSRDVNFLGFNELPYEGEDISSVQDFGDCGHNNVFAFGISANGDFVCFDYRHDPITNEPRIVVMFHDKFDVNNKMLICHVADNFEAFMNSLYKPELRTGT